jgi:AraC-like DNA-binding protein
MSAPGIPTASVQTLVPPIEVLRRQGTPIKPVLEAAGIRESQLSDPELRISTAAARHGWETAVDAAEDPSFGLRAAETVPPVTNTLVTYVGATCATLREAFNLGSRYAGIINGELEFRLHERDTRTVFSTHLMEDSRIAQAAADFIVSLVVRTLPRFVHDLSQMEVWFAHPEPAYRDAYASVIELPFRFDAPMNGLTGPLGCLEWPLPGADPELHAMLQRQAEVALARLPAREGTADATRRAIAAALPHGDPGTEAIAKRLGLGTRTLRRRLEAEGTSHRQLLDEVRSRLAKDALREGLSPNEVAFRVGFSDAPAFYKAFRRWTGTSPGEFLRKSRA